MRKGRRKKREENSHLLANKLEAALDGALGLELLLLEQHGPDELVDDLLILQVVELLGHPTTSEWKKTKTVSMILTIPTA